jgi:hypothetical protein
MEMVLLQPPAARAARPVHQTVANSVRMDGMQQQLRELRKHTIANCGRLQSDRHARYIWNWKQCLPVDKHRKVGHSPILVMEHHGVCWNRIPIIVSIPLVDSMGPVFQLQN